MSWQHGLLHHGEARSIAGCARMLFDLLRHGVHLNHLSGRPVGGSGYNIYGNQTRPAICARMIAETPSMRMGAHKREHLGGPREKPAGVNRRASMPTSTMLAEPEVFRRFLTAVSNHLVAHLGALVEVAEPCLLDGRDMDEYVLAAGVGLNKSEALRWIEPLHCTCRHVRTPCLPAHRHPTAVAKGSARKNPPA